MAISEDSLPYGDGSTKIFGMENFGNTCYCNSILQCLYYTDTFRKKLIQHNQTKHEPKLDVKGIRYHGFTAKYDQLLQKKLKDQGGATTSNSDERPKSSRKSSLFGIKFNNQTNVSTTVSEMKNQYITEAGNCDSLSLEQRILISKSPEFSKLEMMITKPSMNPVSKSTNNGNISITNNNNSVNTTDHSQSSSMLLNDQPLQTIQEGSVNTKSSAIIVGIPKPETNLVTPINPFNNNPSSDQRKRSALINGPIINLDTALQLPSEQTEDTCLLYALRDLFETMIENKSTIGVVSPNYFITTLKEKNYLFRQNNMHHDAHEFFNYLTNEIIESLNKELGEGQNWCNDIFQGLITNETKCLSCETVTSKHENFLDLSIDVPPGEGSYSLNFAINNFSKSETLTNQNKFHCNTCSSLQEAVKNIKVKKLPEVLVINLKRFKYDEQIDKMVKLFDSISYPFKLRLFNTTDDFNRNVLYDLYALVIHIGGGPMHGHYVSICKIKAGLWLLFDDETVELVEDNYVMRFFGNGPGLASSYILFYQKIEFDEKCEYFGFDPSSIYRGDDYTLTAKEELKAPAAAESETKSEMSSINSFNPLDTPSAGTQLNVPQPPKKPPLTTGGMFRSFKFEKNNNTEDKPQHSLSRSSSNGTIPKKEVEQPTKEKKSWVGSLKRTGLERKLSSKTTAGTSYNDLNGNTPNSSVNDSSSPSMPPQQPPPPLEKRKSLFGFKKKN
ncbi:creB [Candida pseudojiufengensis]|uniref:creB n=1 Tax=Candida pseudojiufengensis TaxID=497109 RepID=UPI002224EFC2|nr:creB [Candida pseudojiufengensis]KAI5964636.1 creB [Candida pseudojiufengensis]